jgi:cytochrome c551/c552
MGILQIQDGLAKAGLANRVVTEGNFFHAANEYAKLIFPKKAGMFFTDPSTLPPQQEKPDPELIKLQVKAQTDQLKIKQKYDKMGMDFLETQQGRVDSKQELIASHAHEAGMAARDHAHDHIQNERDRMHEHASNEAQRRHDGVQAERERIAAASQAIKGEQQAQMEEKEMKLLGPALEKIAQSQEKTNEMLSQMAQGLQTNSMQMAGIAELLVNMNNRKVKKTATPVRDKNGNMIGADIIEEPLH